MWTTADVITKREDGKGFFIDVLYGTDDDPPKTVAKSVFLGLGQDQSTFKAAVVQQLADLNASESTEKDTLKAEVEKIPLGPVNIKADSGGVEPIDPGVIAIP